MDWTALTPEADFVEKLARVIEQDGGSRIAGRILGLLLLTPGEMGLDELAEQLQVSKASVSTNARLLEQFGVLERVGHPGDRRDFYRVAPDVVVRVLERRLEWMRRFGEAVTQGAATPAAEVHPAVRERFCALCGVHRRAMRNAERTLRIARSRMEGR